MTALRLADRLTAVYRAFDADGTLLYVGCSCQPDERLLQHYGTPWLPQADEIRAAWFHDRFTALREEAEAITEEGPIYNIRRPDPKDIRPPEPGPEPLPREAGLSLEQAAEAVDIPLHWLWSGVVRGKLPHSCFDPEGDEVWFVPDDVQALHMIFDLPPQGLQRQRTAARQSIRRSVRFKRCRHAAI